MAARTVRHGGSWDMGGHKQPLCLRVRFSRCSRGVADVLGHGDVSDISRIVVPPSTVSNTFQTIMSRIYSVLLVAVLIMPGAVASAMDRGEARPLRSVAIREAISASRFDQMTRSTSKTRDPDQIFLRALADHLEAERGVCHAMMSTPGGHASHGTAMDPGNWDSMFDTQQQETVTLLRHDYREAWATKGPKRATAPVASDTAAEALERGTMESLVSVMRESVALTDRYLPRLRRASSRDLARRVRSSHVKLIKELGAMSGH